MLSLFQVFRAWSRSPRLFRSPRSLQPPITIAITTLLSLLTPHGLAKDFSSTIPANAPVLLRQSGRLEPGDRIFRDDQSLYDTHVFTGQAGQTIRISFAELTFDAFLAVLTASGRQITSSHDTEPIFGDYSPEISLTLPESGRYTIVVNGSRPGDRGDYELIVQGTVQGTVQSPNPSNAPALSTSRERLPLGRVPNQNVGWQAVGNPTLNTIALPVYRYIGECPGGGVGQVAAVFRSDTTPPAGNQVVEIRNVTLGIDDDPYPNITRDYDNGTMSEQAEIGFGAEHIRVFIGRRTMAVMPGLNQFQYIIRDHNTILEEGEFVTEIVPTPSVLPRSSYFRTREYCRTGGSVNRCDRDDIRTRYIEECPAPQFPIPREFEAIFFELFS